MKKLLRPPQPVIITINLIYRKPHPGFFSIEKVFDAIATEAILPHNNIQVNKIYLPFTSRGILSVFFNLIYLKWKTNKLQGLFHITGDVHYSILALPSQRTILTIHDLVFLHTYKGVTRKILKSLYLDLPIKKAHWITTISEKSKQEIIDYAQCDPNKILVIPDPIDPLFITAPTSQSQAISIAPAGLTAATDKPLSADTDSQKPCILFLGTKANKNLELTIPALFQLPVRLRIIGELEKRQKKLLKKFRIDHSHVSNISQKELLKEYRQANMILFPSTYEGFGLPVIEGFATQKPVITSNISPMKEVAGNAALLIDPSSIASIRTAVQRLINEPGLSQQLVAAGQLRVLDFLPAQITDHYKNLWLQVSTHPSNPTCAA